MSYKLEQPYTDFERADFITEYNHKLGMQIEISQNGTLYALEINEILENGVPKINPNYKQELANSREELFKKDFFQTSLGWIRRQVNMKDGSKKDFLSDLLLQIKAGLELGQKVEIITYKEPNFSSDIDDVYMEALQEKKLANLEFVKECLMRTVSDFNGD